MSELTQHREFVTSSFMYRFIRGMLIFFFARICRWRLQGLENVPKDGPIIMAFNHASNWDPMILVCASPRKVHFMAKKELFEVPFVSYIVNLAGSYPVDRSKMGRQALKMSIDILNQGKVIGIFPEGTRSKTGEMGEAKAGTVMIAAKAGAPIVPVGLYNSQNVFSGGWFRPVSVCFGSPIYLNSDGGKLTSKDMHELSEQLMTTIAALVQDAKKML
ncbi:1-acylglycerol-3-phosphate O-acyltransferase [Heliobacillus mobilis]|uniref:1-acyl-sn-glycerol-3-phosphate acyltransferase n=1 Tax=Heliobacterium mobile TaxID=28064 RepID=A0A6I3SFB4_HELMO|nr:lysophospholipid acyltransferase family protein [Heliobacterium mobile]MTV47436.1 1-acylglycerol-3-phosphate O-acyltransferase [Heliobacterium mobile]